MKLRFVEWHGAIYIVMGIGHHAEFDPPETYYTIPLDTPLVQKIITAESLVKIPMSEAIEITDKHRIKVLYILFK